MPLYQVEQYERHVAKYEVEAASEAEAISKVLSGEADLGEPGAQLISTDYVEIDEESGLPEDEYPELARELSRLGVVCGDVISSIRSIEEI
jgi:hypothetical protein